MWNLLNAVKGSDVIEGIDAGGETTVKAEDLVIDEGGQRKVVEQIGKVFPYIGIAILAQALVVEAVHLRNLTRLVVSSKDCDSSWVSNLESDKERHGLYRVVSSINVITCARLLEDYWRGERQVAYP